MFSEDMSGSELLQEYYADLSDIQSQTIKFDNSDYVARYLWKRHKNPHVVLSKIFSAPSGNRYLGILSYNQIGVGKQKQWNFSSFHIGLMDSAKGQCAIASYVQSQQALKFTPHFFQRYKERFMTECDWKTRSELSASHTEVETISVYMKRNLSITWIETKSVFRNKVHIFAPVNDGVALLQWDKSRKLLQANTFVTESMLDEKQVQMVEYAKIYFSLSKTQRKKFRFPDFISDN